MNFTSLISGIFSGISQATSWIGQILTSPKTFLFIGVIAAGIIIYLYTEDVDFTLKCVGLIIVAIIVLWILVKIVKLMLRKRSGKKMVADFEQQATAEMSKETRRDDGGKSASANLLEAVHTIKTSKIGQLSGNAALYELPWYIVIGNPSAGKSSAIRHSGLQFPLDKSGAPVKGVGGTRNCDWFFTTEGILLDTAGRYSTESKDRGEWLDFLDLMKKHRTMAPINGIIVAASIPELMQRGPGFAIDLAKHLRQRVQEMTERLEVFAPVYIFFTKVDLLAGFPEFFENEQELRNQAWGATFPYPTSNEEKRDNLALFSSRFDELYQGLRELSVSQIASLQQNSLTQGMLTFPFEFQAIKPTLETFLATFFENNPYQYKPIFRGFYFTSALQTGEIQDNATPRLNEMFGLVPQPNENIHRVTSDNGFFLKNLFSKIILADKQLVRQHSNPGKRKARFAVFIGMLVALGLTLAGWSWSYLNNQQLLNDTQEDLDAVMRVQAERLDMASRFEAMSILQHRIEALDATKAQHPVSTGLGLYQGDKVKAELLKEYYHGLRQFMIDPVKGMLESYLESADIRPGVGHQRQSGETANTGMGGVYQDLSPNSIDDVYDALKTYLMMSSPKLVEDPAFLHRYVTLFWRPWLESNRGAMPRDEMITNAGQLAQFYVNHVNDTDWPHIQTNPNIVEKSRLALRDVRRGAPAIERIYTTIKTRAVNQFPAVSVASVITDANTDLIIGNYTVPGAYTRKAWMEYVMPELRLATKTELLTVDWVMGTQRKEDLRLQQNENTAFAALEAMYKKEYIAEWQKFMQSLSIKPFTTFPLAAERMNRLGNPETSPIDKLFTRVYEETAWDAPGSAALTAAQGGITGWIKKKFGSDKKKDTAPAGTAPEDAQLISAQFQEVARLLQEGDDKTSVLSRYMENLAKIRTRFNLIQNEGDPGPGTLKLLRETFEGQGSELSDAMRYVDDNIFTGLSETQRATLRPLLVRPLVQAFAAVIPPAEAEINKVWLAQVYEPFNERLATKYPFNNAANLEATSAEIGTIFGPDGSIAAFVADSMAPLTIRRGNIMTSRTWGDMGINIVPAFTANFAEWIAPLTGGASAGGGAQTVFQIQPRPITNAVEYTITIDGQQMRYRNTPPSWVNFVWPYDQGAPGAQITALLPNGQTVKIFDEPGRYGLERLLGAARRQKNPDGTFTMYWTKQGVTVSVVLRIVSMEQQTTRGFNGLRLPATVAGDQATTRNTPSRRRQ